ncbi:hypothetical protein FS749_000553 [Ceratobasidium sp. UAMH 11750]|nr:hypothetical protein FS749_000553 [Ceratobasidium sp. UAMH 11750]
MSVSSISHPSKLKASKPKKDKKPLASTDQPPEPEPNDAPITAEVAPTEAKVDEVEVLSHAAQRKAKKRKLKELQSGEDDNDEPAPKPAKPKPKSEPDDKPVLPARQNSVWVGNLSFKTTEAQLKEFFDGVGEITRVHMPKKQVVGQGRGMRGENRGFAYVDFATPDAQTLAITFSEKNLDGRRLLIKNGDDFTGRPDAPKATNKPEQESAETSTVPQQPSTTHSKTAQKILSSQKQPAAQTLFMGNLPFETKEDDIRQMIEGHGLPSELEEQAKQDSAAKNPGGKPLRWLKKIRMGTFEDSGMCKGWAFLDFLNTTYATAILVNPRNHHLNGRKLVLEYGSPDAVRRGGGGLRPRKGQAEKEQPEDTPRAAKRRKYVSAEDGEETKPEPRKSIPKGDEQYVRAKDGRLRPRPGAALAMARREAVAIVPSAGKKTVF